jgi:CRISPR-associated protein Csx17
VPDLRLSGCQSHPLVGYLKALGLLRVISRQVDESARGRWSAGVFELRSELSEEQLTTFLLERYAPSPVLSPWNGRSGFYRRGNATAVKALERIQQSDVSRLAPLRTLIERTQIVLADLQMTEKPSEESQKLKLVRRLRREWPDDAVEWLDAAIVMTGKKPAFPPLLGSGGNDGSYDFSSNYMQSLGEIMLAGEKDSRSREMLGAALLGEPNPIERMALAHLSRDASSNNSPYGEAESLGNPWDLVLAIEGSLLLTPGAARRYGALGGGVLVAPFTVHPTAAGYGSAVSGETGRAELWLPLWPGWTSRPEVSSLTRESWVQVGRGPSRRQARTGLDFARAAGELGVARGIESFERYAILERAGQANLAVPIGQISAAEHPGAQALRSIDGWLERVLRLGATDNCPNAIQAAARRLDEACFHLASRGRSRDACAALEAIGAMEHALGLSRAAIEAGIHPLSGVSATPWVEVANDGTPEFAVAAALGSLRDRRQRLPALRDYLHGTRRDEERPWRSVFDVDRRHAVSGGNVAARLAAIHSRRHLDATRRVAKGTEDTRSMSPASDDELSDDRPRSQSALSFERGAPCDMRLARTFAAGGLDSERILHLLWGLALLDHSELRSHLSNAVDPAVAYDATVQPIFDFLSLAWRGRSHRRGDEGKQEQLHPSPGWAARLAAGAIEPVVREASLRLRLAGLAPILTARDLIAGISDASRLGPRLGSALLIPLRPGDLDRATRRLTMPEQSDKSNDERKETS